MGLSQTAIQQIASSGYEVGSVIAQEIINGGWKYYLTKIEEVPEGHAVWFTGGSAVHKATERFDKGDVGETTNLDELWNDTWFKQVKEDEAINGDMNTWQYRGQEDMSWWYGEGWWMLDRWTKFLVYVS